MFVVLAVPFAAPATVPPTVTPWASSLAVGVKSSQEPITEVELPPTNVSVPKSPVSTLTL